MAGISLPVQTGISSFACVTNGSQMLHKTATNPPNPQSSVCIKAVSFATITKMVPDVRKTHLRT